LLGARVTVARRADGAAAAMQPAASLSSSWQRALYLPLIILAWLAIILVVGWIAGHFTRTILMVVLSAVIAFALMPIANLLQRWLPRMLAIGLAYVLGIGVILGVLAFIVLTAAAQTGNLVTAVPEYAKQLQGLQPQLQQLLGRVGVPPDRVADIQQQLLDQIQIVGGSVAGDALGWVTSIFATLIDLILVLILSVYLAANGASIADWLKNEAPETQRHRAHLLVAVTNRVVGGYIRGTVILALLIGALVGVGMAVLGVPYPVLLGVLAFFMEFVPILGVFISGAAAVVLALLHFQEPIRPAIVLAYFVFVHIIEGDVVGPRILGKAVGIHPAVGLIAFIAGTEVFGIWGALFAAPVAGLLQAVVTATIIELRGAAPQEVVKAVAEEASEEFEQQVQADTGLDTDPAATDAPAEAAASRSP